MFAIAALIGAYSYAIFLLGILSLLTTTNILVVSAVFTLIAIYILWPHFHFHIPKLTLFSKFLLALITAQCLVNFIGALGPEIGFDALWYHLSLPKLWLQSHSMFYISGAQFKYSVMPMLTEMFYFFPQVSKLVHYSFGLLALLVTYKLSRKYLIQSYSLLAVLIMSSNLVFAWESTSAYIDLARTFFEILALYLLVSKNYYQSAVSLGLAVCTKLIAFASLPVFLLLLLVTKTNKRFMLNYSLLVILVVSPWLIRAFLATGNPFYPLLSPLYPTTDFSFNLNDIWILFTQNPDPVNPIYIITAPLVLFMLPKLRSRGVGHVILYCLAALVMWFITPRTGGGRFILPYLPAFSVLAAVIISEVRLKKVLISVTTLIAVSTLVYRIAANQKFIPVLLHHQLQQDFLAGHLNYSFGDFSDTDGTLTKLIKPNQSVLVVGINNLFYIPARVYTLDTLTPTDQVDFILWRYTDAPFPSHYSSWFEIYHNPQTKTKLFAPRPTTTAFRVSDPAACHKLFCRL